MLWVIKQYLQLLDAVNLCQSLPNLKVRKSHCSDVDKELSFQLLGGKNVHKCISTKSYKNPWCRTVTGSNVLFCGRHFRSVRRQRHPIGQIIYPPPSPRSPMNNSDLPHESYQTLGWLAVRWVLHRRENCGNHLWNIPSPDNHQS